MNDGDGVGIGDELRVENEVRIVDGAGSDESKAG